MRDIGRTVKDLVDAVTTVSLDDTAIPALCVFLDYVSWLPEEHSRLHICDGFVEALSRRLDDPDSIRVCERFVAHVVRLI
jgi:hypothetical protein